MSYRSIMYPVVFFGAIFAAIMLNSCEKEDYDLSANTETSTIVNPLSWLKPFEDGRIKRSEIFILHETLIGSTSDNPPVRVTANFWDHANDEPVNLSQLLIGNATINSDAGAERKGMINQLFSQNSEAEIWTLLGSYANQKIPVTVLSDAGVVDEFTVKPAPPLKPTVSQGANNPLVLGELDKTLPLTFKWPVPEPALSLRDGAENEYREVVGASLVYLPKTSLDITGDATLPVETITVKKSELFDVGSLTFTEDDLALLPSNGFIIVYIGGIRYEIDEDGDLVYSPAGTVTYSGGGSTGPLIRVNEP